MMNLKLKNLLKTHNIKQTELVEHLDISPSRLSNYLAGRRIDIDMLTKIALYFKVDLNFFSNIDFAHSGTVPVPCIKLDADSIEPYKTILFDKTLVEQYKQPLIIESTTDAFPLRIREGALMLTEKYDPTDKSFIRLVILPGADYRIFEYKKIDGDVYFHIIRGNKLIRPDPNVTYYTIRWILQ